MCVFGAPLAILLMSPRSVFRSEIRREKVTSLKLLIRCGPLFSYCRPLYVRSCPLGRSLVRGP